MPTVTIGKTPVAARLLRYTLKPKPGDTEKDRVLHVAGQHCRPETSMEEFAAVRRRHGKQGAMRRSPAKYLLPEDGEEATHVRDTRPGGRRYWREAREGEEATHIKHEADYVRQNEAVHYIIGFGPDEVNVDDPEQVAHAFDYTAALFRQTMPGLQVHLVGQADGKGMTPDSETGELRGKFHVHAVANAVVYEDMNVDGREWRAGAKMAGNLTEIDQVRERHDEYMREHPDWGFTQKAKSVEDQKKERRSTMDRRMASRGERSNHDVIREAFWSALSDLRSVDDAFMATMDDPRTADRSAFEAVMAEYGAEHGLSVTDPGWRRGKPPKTRRISFKVEGMQTSVRGETLGEQYSGEFLHEQLRAVAEGRSIEPRVGPAAAGPPKPVAAPSPKELDEARAVVVELAEEERLDAWVDDWAREEQKPVGQLLGERHLDITDEGDRDRLRAMMARQEKSEGEKTAKRKKASTNSKPTASHEGNGPSEADQRQPDGNASSNLVDSMVSDIAQCVDERADDSAVKALLAEWGLEGRGTSPPAPSPSHSAGKAEEGTEASPDAPVARQERTDADRAEERETAARPVSGPAEEAVPQQVAPMVDEDEAKDVTTAVPAPVAAEHRREEPRAKAPAPSGRQQKKPRPAWMQDLLNERDRETDAKAEAAQDGPSLGG